VAVTDDGGDNEPVLREATSIEPGLSTGRGRGLALIGELADCSG
jgi:hypothetical protein